MSERFTTVGPHPDVLPGGTLTFMFGDLAGSTILVEQLGDRYADVLVGYHQVVADATLSHDGTVVDLEGERLFSVFQDAFQAVSATVEIQKALEERLWPESAAVQACLGLHTGTARIGSGGYVGSTCIGLPGLPPRRTEADHRLRPGARAGRRAD